MQWFRMYHELADDPKVQRLPDNLFRAWINLLCYASKHEPRGTLPPLADLAFQMRMTERKLASILAKLEAAGLLDRDGETLQPHNWHGRQRVSDNVAERVRKHRQAATRNVTRNVTATAPDTDTDTDTDTEKNDAPAAAAAPLVGTPPGTSQGEQPRKAAPALSLVPAVSEPFRLLQVLGEETGFGKDGLPEREKKKQLAIAKRILDGGEFTEADVRDCIRYMMTETWRGDIIELGAVEKVIGKWTASGRPAVAKARAGAASSRGSNVRLRDDTDWEAERKRMEARRAATAK